MEYVVYRRFKAEGIDGSFNLPFGTIVNEINGFLRTDDGRRICAAHSENGWEHFRPNTPDGAYRQKLLDKLYRYYLREDRYEDFEPTLWPKAENLYWKNLLRTMSTKALTKYYAERLGQPPETEE